MRKILGFHLSKVRLSCFLTALCVVMLTLSSCKVEEAFEGGLVGEDRVGSGNVLSQREVVASRVGVALRDYALASQVAVLEETGNLSDMGALSSGVLNLNASAFGAGVDISGASAFVSSAYCVDAEGLGYQVSWVGSEDADGASFIRGLGRAQGASVVQGLLGDFSRHQLGVVNGNGGIELLSDETTSLPSGCALDLPEGAPVVVFGNMSAGASFVGDESQVVYRSVECEDDLVGSVLEQIRLTRDGESGSLVYTDSENTTQSVSDTSSIVSNDALPWEVVQENCFTGGSNAIASALEDVGTFAADVDNTSELSGKNAALGAETATIEVSCNSVGFEEYINATEEERAQLDPELAATYENCAGSEGDTELSDYTEGSGPGVNACTDHPELSSYGQYNTVSVSGLDDYVGANEVYIASYSTDTFSADGVSTTGSDIDSAEGTSEYYEWEIECAWSEELRISCSDIATHNGYDGSYTLTDNTGIRYTRSASVSGFNGSHITYSQTPPALGTTNRTSLTKISSSQCQWEKVEDTGTTMSCPSGYTMSAGEDNKIYRTEIYTVTDGLASTTPTQTSASGTETGSMQCEQTENYDCDAPQTTTTQGTRTLLVTVTPQGNSSPTTTNDTPPTCEDAQSCPAGTTTVVGAGSSGGTPNVTWACENACNPNSWSGETAGMAGPGHFNCCCDTPSCSQGLEWKQIYAGDVNGVGSFDYMCPSTGGNTHGTTCSNEGDTCARHDSNARGTGTTGRKYVCQCGDAGTPQGATSYKWTFFASCCAGSACSVKCDPYPLFDDCNYTDGCAPFGTRQPDCTQVRLGERRRTVSGSYNGGGAFVPGNVHTIFECEEE